MPATRKTIVFLTSNYLDYSKVCAEVVSSVAMDAGFGTLCVTGRELETESEIGSENSVCNGIYRLIEKVDVAGLICESGMLGHRAGPDAVCQLLSRFQLPCVSLGLNVPGRPSVIPDDVQSMWRLMEHLVMDTGCKRFAFVRGIPMDTYSLEREGIFRNALANYDLAINERLIVTGNYNVFDAYDAIETLLLTNEKIDAIVCANDMMALGAARAVTARGLNIPHDLVVSGFDDVPDATRHSPALTTVRQPLVEMAETAVAKLLALIEDQPSDPRYAERAKQRLTTVSSELIVRGSTLITKQLKSNREYECAVDLHQLIDAGMTGLKSPVDIDLHILAQELDHTIRTGSSRFAKHLGCIVSRVNHTDAHWWSNLCHQIEEISKCVILVHSHDERLPYIVSALTCIRERVWAIEMEKEFSARRLAQTRSSMQLAIGSCSGMNEFLDVIDNWISMSCPMRYFLVCYDKPSSEPQSTGRLIRAFRNKSSAQSSKDLFCTLGVLPDEFADELEHGTLVLNPVYAGGDHFGYLMIDPQGIDLSQIDSAAHSIGTALRSHYLIESLKSHADRLKGANEELSKLANFDALTGLPNRLYFERQLRELCESWSGDNENFVLCFLDLDGFKLVNDVYGHEVGDQLLKSVSNRLESVLGDHGFVARLGGDEFTMIVDSSDLDRLTSAVLTTLSEVFWLADQEVHITSSIGAAVFPEDGFDVETLLKCADSAMYKAKSLGKNRFIRYSQDRNIQLLSLPSDSSKEPALRRANTVRK